MPDTKSSRNGKDDKRSTTVYSCVTHERELRKYREECKQKQIEDNFERSARWRRKWMEMPEQWREKERRLLREEKIEQMREKIAQAFSGGGVGNRSEEFKEERLKEQIMKIEKDPLINDDLWMADFMKRKYGHDFLNYESGELPTGPICTFCDSEPEFATSRQLMRHIEVVHNKKPKRPGSQPAMPLSRKVSGELSDLQKSKKERAKQLKPVKPELPTGWMCTFCDPEPEFASKQLLVKHIEAVHPEIKTLN